jgi:hypothetical protein
MQSSYLKRANLLVVAVIAAMTLMAGSPASAQEGGGPADDVGVADLAPGCVERTYHDHGRPPGGRKEVHLVNTCGRTMYVKVIVAYGPDSECIRMDSPSGWVYWWQIGWPYDASRFDRLDLC